MCVLYVPSVSVYLLVCVCMVVSVCMCVYVWVCGRQPHQMILVGDPRWVGQAIEIATEMFRNAFEKRVCLKRRRITPFHHSS